MGFFSELEGSLEKYIEGFFKEKFKSNLQPVEIAKKMAREMRDRRRAGLSETYVPNCFAIYLGQEDLVRIKPHIDRLAMEMKEYVINKAKEKKYNFLGPVTVTIDEETDITPGHFIIKSFFEEVPDDNQQGQPVAEDTLRYIPVRDTKLELLEQCETAILEVVEGILKGQRYTMENNQTIIGRGEICNICLPDNNISRRHALISRMGYRYVIKDQSSTNGTYVNGVRINQMDLVSGDVIKIGKTKLTFKVE